MGIERGISLDALISYQLSWSKHIEFFRPEDNCLKTWPHYFELYIGSYPILVHRTDVTWLKFAITCFLSLCKLKCRIYRHHCDGSSSYISSIIIIVVVKHRLTPSQWPSHWLKLVIIEIFEKFWGWNFNIFFIPKIHIWVILICKLRFF